MGPNSSRWSSALLLALTLLSNPSCARPVELFNDGGAAIAIAANTFTVPPAEARPRSWPYLKRHEFAWAVEDDAASNRLGSAIFEGETLGARSAEPKHVTTTPKPTTAVTSNTTLTSTTNTPTAKYNSTTTLSTTTIKIATTPTTYAKHPTTTKESTSDRTSTDKATTTSENSTSKATTTSETSINKTTTTGESTSKPTEKSTTEKSSTTTENYTHTTLTSTTTKPGSTVTATITAGTTTETLTVEPTTLPNPTNSETLLSSSIVVPTVTAVPSGPPPPPPPPGKKLKIAIENNIKSTKPVHAYLTGVNPSGQLVMLTTDGSFYVPSTTSSKPVDVTANIALPLSSGTTTHFTLPDYISSARVWFAEGELQFAEVATSYGVGLVEPTVTNIHDSSEAVRWGFAEFTYGSEEGLYANLSFVDFVGMPIGLNLTTPTGPQSAPGIPGNGTAAVCNALKQQAKKDGQPWDKLCELDSDGKLIRVLSPSSYISINPDAFTGYFDDYANQVWQKYTSEPLYIVSQSSAGQISCQVENDLLTCDGDNRGYPKPSAADVFSCDSGPFAIEQGDNDVHLAVVPRLCAAFNRATLLVPGGNLQPSVLPKDYYTVTPNNFYSKVVHTEEILGKGYAFPYDDVAPTGKTNVAGLVASSDPTLLKLRLAA